MRVEPLEARAVLAATYPPSFTAAPVAEGISSGTAIEVAPNGDLWVVEQGGAVKRFVSGSTTADVVGDISNLGLNSSGERGLLGIAFDPQFTVNKRVYLYYTATTPFIHNRISRFAVDDSDAADNFFEGTSAADPDAGATGAPTPTIVFDLNPLSGATNHNGGAIHFGPDGKLYAAVGENANPSNAQTLGNLLGKVLRINSDGTVPPDNPFFDMAIGDNRAIWALGLRNPFTFTFQPGTGRMFINDVGQNTWEEINEGVAGSNYGWPATEGDTGTPPASPGDYRGPVYAYSHGGSTFQGFAITGGAFYNPATVQFPTQYVGGYFFADFVNSWINVLDISSGNVTQFATDASNPVDLRVMSDGSLIYLARGSGEVVRVSFPVNGPPTISDIADQGMLSDGTLSLPFVVGDAETPPAGLLVTASSDNNTLLPPGSLTVSGAGANRTLQIATLSNQSGSAAVTVTVSDGNLFASDTFTLSVSARPFPWHNPVNGLDVDLDEFVTPTDALMIINYLNTFDRSELPAPTEGFAPPPYYDVSPDNFVAPDDALLVINYLNAQTHAALLLPVPSGEGEAVLALLLTADCMCQARVEAPRRRSAGYLPVPINSTIQS